MDNSQSTSAVKIDPFCDAAPVPVTASSTQLLLQTDCRMDDSSANATTTLTPTAQSQTHRSGTRKKRSSKKKSTAKSNSKKTKHSCPKPKSSGWDLDLALPSRFMTADKCPTKNVMKLADTLFPDIEKTTGYRLYEIPQAHRKRPFSKNSKGKYKGMAGQRLNNGEHRISLDVGPQKGRIKALKQIYIIDMNDLVKNARAKLKITVSNDLEKQHLTTAVAAHLYSLVAYCKDKQIGLPSKKSSAQHQSEEIPVGRDVPIAQEKFRSDRSQGRAEATFVGESHPELLRQMVQGRVPLSWDVFKREFGAEFTEGTITKILPNFEAETANTVAHHFGLRVGDVLRKYDATQAIYGDVELLRLLLSKNNRNQTMTLIVDRRSSIP